MIVCSSMIFPQRCLNITARAFPFITAIPIMAASSPDVSDTICFSMRSIELSVSRSFAAFSNFFSLAAFLISSESLFIAGFLSPLRNLTTFEILSAYSCFVILPVQSPQHSPICSSRQALELLSNNFEESSPFVSARLRASSDFLHAL